jgi:hypothetical protein
MSIDASAGIVVLGTLANNTMLTNATLASGSAGLVAVTADGEITLGDEGNTYASLKLEATGAVSLTGIGKVNIGKKGTILDSTAGTTSGVRGSFTAAGTSGTPTITITPTSDAGATSIVGSALTTLALSGTARIVIPDGATNIMVLEGVLVDLSTAGTIVIGDNSILTLGASTATAPHAGGIITVVDSTGTASSAVAAGGAASGGTAVSITNVSSYTTKNAVTAILTQVASTLTVAGTITGNSNAAKPNNIIDAGDTFALAAGGSPAIDVTHN